MITSKSRIGDISELVAVTWLLNQGYEVFRNVSSVGPIDLIALNSGELLKIDVKTARLNKTGKSIGSGKGLAERINKQDIRVIFVLDNIVCMWDKDFISTYC